MAKRKAWLHIDLSGLKGDRITLILLEHRDELRDLGFKTPVHDPTEGHLAWLEMLRLHGEHGLRRRVVQGHWAEISRRAYKGSKVPLLSIPGFGAADPAQVALILDILHGLKLNVVATVPADPTPEQASTIEQALAGWQAKLKPDRLHRVPVAPGDWAAAWRGYAELVGLDAEGWVSAPRT